MEYVGFWGVQIFWQGIVQYLFVKFNYLVLFIVDGEYYLFVEVVVIVFLIVGDQYVGINK